MRWKWCYRLLKSLCCVWSLIVFHLMNGLSGVRYIITKRSWQVLLWLSGSEQKELDLMKWAQKEFQSSSCWGRRWFVLYFEDGVFAENRSPVDSANNGKKKQEELMTNAPTSKNSTESIWYVCRDHDMEMNYPSLLRHEWCGERGGSQYVSWWFGGHGALAGKWSCPAKLFELSPYVANHGFEAKIRVELNVAPKKACFGKWNPRACTFWV